MSGSKNQVFGIALFVVIGVSALALGVLSMAKSIGSPMRANRPVANVPSAALDLRAAEELKAKDTDGDGLSDYDELNFYRTSPYIKDTDSDGIGDGTEAEKGSDPLCPHGKDCELRAPAGNPAIGSPSGEEGSPDLGGFLSGNLGAEEIREMLKQAGVDPAALGSFTDDQLMKLYEETAGSVSGSASSESAAAEEVRKLLREQGVSEDILGTFSDSELIQMYNETAVGVNSAANSDR